ncbi:Bax inhibitor-1/YccA family protein [Streptococcus plurextorum]|uniref:Bax inhibitor-1/YccA family protein n=1 Tax=Streptococcus plurextorum TaxID=456876 RepID=UPI0004003EF9|nr:Bax inhibitor-1/YccA family protein [Streptococcus plurextorum]
MEFQNNVIYTESDAGLNRFFAKIYGLVGLGIALSAVVSGLMLYRYYFQVITILQSASWVYYAAIFGQLALVWVASSAARKNSPSALPLFLTYSALNGFTLSFILIFYAQSTVFQAFISSALVFMVMAVLGMVIKKDLSGIAKALYAALIGVVIASLVNIFIGSGTMSYIISLISVVIFAGLIAYENQLIKQVYRQTGGRVGDGWAISMALNLYLDFINLFLNMLRLLSRND